MIPMKDIIYKDESYQIIGKCFEVHNNLGPGFLEIVYKLALIINFGELKLNSKRIVL